MPSVWFFIAAAFLILRSVTFVRTRDPLELVQAVMWLLLGAHVLFPNALLLGLVALFLIVSLLWKVSRWRSIRSTLSGKGLRSLSSEEKKFRANLDEETRSSLEFLESIQKERMSPNEVAAWLTTRAEVAESDLAEKREQEEEEREESLIREEEEESSRFKVIPKVRIRFQLERSTEVQTADSREHTLSSGSYTGDLGLSVLPEVDETTPVNYRLAIHLPSGDLEVTGSLRKLLVPWIDHVPTEGAFVYWSEAPAPWREAFAQRCIATKIQGSDDSRERFPLSISGKERCIMTKYSCWFTDLAVTEDGTKLIVRIRDLHSEVWDGDIFADDAPDDVPFLDIERLPVFCCEMPIETMLPITAARNEDEDEVHPGV